MLSAIIACGIQVLQVKLRARLFFKTTCTYTCVTSWQYSFYNTIARLIYPIVLYLLKMKQKSV